MAWDGNSWYVAGIGSCTDTDVVIPSEHEGKPVTRIGNFAFGGCTGLTSIMIPDSVTYIGDSAFSGTAYYNDEANWSNGMLYISSALIGCKTDKTGAVSIKEETTCIAASAFSGCTGLTSITFTGTKARWKVVSKDDNWKRNTGSFTVHCTDGDIPYEDA